MGKDTVSRTWRKVKSDWDAWNTRSFAEEPIVRLILDGTVGACGLTAKRPPFRSWSYRRTSGWPKGSARDQEHGWESAGAWRTVLDDLIKRGLLGPSFASSMARPGSTAGGYAVALMARGANQRPGGGTRRCACLQMRCTDAAFVKNAFARVSVDLGEVEFLIYNAGSGSGGSIEEITPEAFEAARRVNALGSLLVSRQVIPAMKRVGAGSIIFIGATASLPGMPRTAAFAPAKAAQRILAESMARSLWPAGIHLAIVILDGVVDLPKTREMMTDKSDDFFIKPKDVAKAPSGCPVRRGRPGRSPSRHGLSVRRGDGAIIRLFMTGGADALRSPRGLNVVRCETAIRLKLRAKRKWPTRARNDVDDPVSDIGTHLTKARECFVPALAKSPHDGGLCLGRS